MDIYTRICAIPRCDWSDRNLFIRLPDQIEYLYEFLHCDFRIRPDIKNWLNTLLQDHFELKSQLSPAHGFLV